MMIERSATENAHPIAEIRYPVLLWRPGYIFRAEAPLELCTHPRSLFAQTRQLARERQWRLIDAAGGCYELVDWMPVRPFGGIRGFVLRMIGSQFAEPVLVERKQLSLAQFKDKVAGALRSRHGIDAERSAQHEAMQRLRQADSYQAVLDTLPWP